jgi:hypothetical protein
LEVANPASATYAAQLVRRALVTILLIFLLVPAAAGAADATTPWKPAWNSAVRYAKHRKGIIGFALRTAKLDYGFRSRRTMPCASVFKAMALVAYLNHPDVRDRKLNSHDKSLLRPMITRSSDHAADQVFRYVGAGRIRALARKVPMYRFHLNTKIWGRSSIDAADQARFMLQIDKLIPERHRSYAMYLLSHITHSQRWGIFRVTPKGWKAHAKAGWGLGTGWVDHQVVLLTRGNQRVSVAVLQHSIGNSKAAHAYGKNTLKGIFGRLLRGLDKAQVVE